MRALLPAAAVLAAACSSTLPDSFECREDQECGAGGRCESTAACSFTDSGCVSGRRYGELSTEALAGLCVPMCVRAEPYEDYSVCDDGCTADLVGRELTSHIGSATNGADYALGTTALGELGLAGRVWFRATLRLKQGQTVTEGHWLYILKTRYLEPPEVMSPVWSLFIGPDNALKVTAYGGDSPAADVGVTVPNDGSDITVEVSAAVDDSVTVRVGEAEVTLSDLSGMPPRQSALDVGISHYDGVNAPAIDVVIRSVNWSAFDWVSSCPTP